MSEQNTVKDANTAISVVVVSAIIACAASAGVSYAITRNYDDRIDAANATAVNADIEVSRVRSNLGDAIVEAQQGARDAATSALECKKTLLGVRDELDEIQTQIRLLKLGAR